MAVTRNQKRKIEEIGAVSTGEEDRQNVGEKTQPNVTLTKKRKTILINKDAENGDDTNSEDPTYKPSSEPSTEDNGTNEHSDVEDEIMDSSAEYTVSSTSEEESTTANSNEGNMIADDDADDNANDDADDADDDNSQDPTYTGLNLKLTKPQIAEIIKQSVRQLIRTYKENGMEFLTKAQKGEKNYDTEYDTFLTHVDTIYGGEFFERIPIEERVKKLKEELSPEQVQELNGQLNLLRDSYKDKAPSIIDVLKMKIPETRKKALLERFHHVANNPVLSEEYNKHMKYLLNNVVEITDEDKQLAELEEQITAKCVGASEFSYKKAILKSEMTLENKVHAFEKLSIMETYDGGDSSEYAKYKHWLDTLLSVPFGKYIDIPVFESPTSDMRTFLKQVRHTLDEHLSYLENPKDQIINLVAQMMKNKDAGINAIGIYGEKGTGKTSVVKSIAKALGRPYRMISLGGESDNSVLTGHGFTYVGSMPGRIIDILRETQCMNPIILIDELDKISGTMRGQEIIGTLIHMTDYTTNKKYNYDRYFSGIEFDLSKVLFVFTYNEPALVDKILADRLFKIKVDNYTASQKREIACKHIIPNVLKEFGLKNDDVIFPVDTMDVLINTSSGDSGMRDIKRKIEIMISRINTLMLIEEGDEIVNLDYKKLCKHFKHLPITIQSNHVKALLCESFCSNQNTSMLTMYT